MCDVGQLHQGIFERVRLAALERLVAFVSELPCYLTPQLMS